MYASLFLLFALAVADDPQREFAVRREAPRDLRDRVAAPTTSEGFSVRLERITTAVPWPRGLVSVGDDLVVLARGRHRNAGGIDPSIADRSGSLFVVDPDCFEPVVLGESAGREVRENASLLVAPEGAPFRLYDPARGVPIDATEIDRPYCTLAWDALSRNLFICGYSGVDLPGKRFRKNASDSILRYDLRDESWHVVERHDPGVVPRDELGYVVSNAYYPHHDPARESAPHGWLNGPDGALAVGDYLYAAGKDNHAVARYDLRAIRRDPAAGVPESTLVLGSDVRIRLDGEVQRFTAMGPSALEANDGYLYVGYRTSSVILRFAIDERGRLVEPPIGELIAVFEPWNPETGTSANLIDIAFDSEGRLYASCAQMGRIWNIGVPDPTRVYDGVDRGAEPTKNLPYVDLRTLTSNPRARCGNIAFDAGNRLYICSGNYDSGTDIAGVIYRAVCASPTARGG